MNKFFSLFSVISMFAATMYGQTATPSNAATKQPSPCDCLDRGLELPMDTKCFAPAYLAPANIKLNDCWDINLSASFIYWHVSQEGMNVASSGPATDSSVNEFNMHNPTFSFKPGFKINLGYSTNYDDWTGFFEYTWLHQSTHHSSSVGSDVFVPVGTVQDPVHSDYNSVESHWKMNMDMLDFGMSRPFYFSKKITMTPVGGLRALWIRERFDREFSDASSHSLDLRSKSHSWAFGPMVGSLTRWFFGQGFRFEGKGSGAVLYTRYNGVSTKQVETVTDVAAQSNVNVLRPMIDLAIGMGWGTYIGCQDYYIDLSAQYDFNVLWDQNVMMNSAQAFNQSHPVAGTNGNLYMHGLTLNARFDF